MKRLKIILLALSLLFAAGCSTGAQEKRNGNGNGNGAGQGSGVGHGSGNAGEKQSPQPQQSPQGELNPGTVESRLSELALICKSGKVEEAASYFVYRGPDKAREWKDTLHASDPVEKAALEENCREIKSMLIESNGFITGEVKVERESEGEWHALEVTVYPKEGGMKKVIFAFLRVGGEFAIGDIDQ